MPSIYALIFLFSTIFHAITAQNPPAQSSNIVPNGGFEEFDGIPIGWYYKGADFDNVVKYWSSPTNASPDAYSPRVHVPASWAEKGFGKQSPHSGQNFAGITVYGCNNGKPHCREYIQIQLREPLVIGQNYSVEYYFSQLPNSLRINNLGMCFTEKSVQIIGEPCLNTLKPQVKATKTIEAKNGSWAKFTAKFTALIEAEWLIIGNFNDDETTNIMSSPTVKGLNYAYYYLDDISVEKREPIKSVPIKADDLGRVPLEVGKTIRLKNIYFDTDKADLLPRSNVELNKLFKILIDNPTLEIEIIGHTDNIGGVDYNLTLSRRRAEMVMTYLVSNGIDARRLRTNGFGSGQPIAPNDTEERRQINRRVECKILKK